MANPILAFYDAVKITVPSDIDKTYPPVLRNQKVDLFADKDKARSLEAAQAAVDEILSRAGKIVVLSIVPNLEILPTAPKDGINIIRRDGTKTELLATIRGDQLLKMSPEQRDAKEEQIYRILGTALGPAKNKAPAPVVGG